MQSEGRIAGDPGDALSPWDPSRELEALTEHAARFSRGFLAAPPAAWFTGLLEHWLPLFHSLGSEISVSGIERGFEFPAELYRKVLIEFDGEAAILGYGRETADRLVNEVVPGAGGAAAAILLEYLERRLLSSLAAAWSGNEPLQCHYYGDRQETEEAAVIGAIEVTFRLSGSPLTIWFGIGPEMLDRLDAAWRSQVLERNREGGRNPLTDQIHSVSIELAELAVPPALLIDYMRSGTIIDLEVPVSAEVQVRVDGDLWAEGVLRRFDRTFAVEILDKDPQSREYPSGTTQVRVQIARTELDEAGILEHAQEGAVLLCDTDLASRVSLIISGEDVAFATIGSIDGRFALQILAK